MNAVPLSGRSAGIVKVLPPVSMTGSLKEYGLKMVRE